MKGKQGEISLLISAINASKAGLVNAYSSAVIADFNRNINCRYIKFAKSTGETGINTIAAFWYNPDMNYKIYMVPGILVILVTMISLLLSAINIVREKEIGTIEQINVTPVKKYQFILGKLFPFFIIALFELAFGLTVGKLVYNIIDEEVIHKFENKTGKAEDFYDLEEAKASE